ncbi:MAG: hypothetical protein J0L94_03045 [Rhodothermia bacterium]|nr:hypothetical protein [Rhodothermia bacterium]
MKNLILFLLIFGFLFSFQSLSANVKIDDAIKSVEAKSAGKVAQANGNDLTIKDIEKVARKVCTQDNVKCTITVAVEISMPGVESSTASIKVEEKTCKKAVSEAIQGVKGLKSAF